MEGAAERAHRTIERNVALAWWTATLADAGDKRKPLQHYLDQLKPKKAQTAEDVRAVFLEYQARGAAVTIRHIGPDGKELN